MLLYLKILFSLISVLGVIILLYLMYKLFLFIRSLFIIEYLTSTPDNLDISDSKTPNEDRYEDILNREIKAPSPINLNVPPFIDSPVIETNINEYLTHIPIKEIYPDDQDSDKDIDERRNIENVSNIYSNRKGAAFASPTNSFIFLNDGVEDKNLGK